MLPVVFMKICGRYLNSAKWLIFRDFAQGFLPVDIESKYDVEKATLQKYFREWKVSGLCHITKFGYIFHL